MPSTNLGLRFVPAATLQYYPRAKIESLVVVVVVKLGKDTLVKFFSPEIDLRLDDDYDTLPTYLSTTTTSASIRILLLKSTPTAEFSPLLLLSKQQFLSFCGRSRQYDTKKIGGSQGPENPSLRVASLTRSWVSVGYWENLGRAGGSRKEKGGERRKGE